MADQNADYMLGLNMLADITKSLLQVADIVDVPKLRTVCGQMQALGPILEPTAYMRGGMENLRDQERLLAAVDAFVAEVKTLNREEPTGA